MAIKEMKLFNRILAKEIDQKNGLMDQKNECIDRLTEQYSILFNKYQSQKEEIQQLKMMLMDAENTVRNFKEKCKNLNEDLVIQKNNNKVLLDELMKEKTDFSNQPLRKRRKILHTIED